MLYSLAKKRAQPWLSALHIDQSNHFFASVLDDSDSFKDAGSAWGRERG